MRWRSLEGHLSKEEDGGEVDQWIGGFVGYIR